MKIFKLASMVTAGILVTNTAFCQWTEDTDQNTIISDAEGAKYVPKVAVNGDGIYYFSWFGGSDNLNMNLQALDFEGNALWMQNGITVSTGEQNSFVTDYALTTDSAGNAVVAFTDIRTGPTITVLYKVSPDGSMLFGEGGISLPGTANQYVPHLAITPDNEIVVAYMEEADAALYSVIQKFGPEGNAVWDAPVLVTADEAGIQNPVPLACSDGSVLVVYYEQTGPFWSPARRIMAQKYAADGTAVWPTPVEVCGDTGIPGFATLQVSPDGADGALVAWYDDSDNNTLQNVAVQHVSADGSLAFPANGVVVGTNETNLNHLAVVPPAIDEEGNVIVFWTQADANQSEFGLRGQKVSPEGIFLWGASGLEAIPLNNTFQMLIDLKLHADTSYVTYLTNTAGQILDQQIKVIAIGPDGSLPWTESKILASSNSEKIHADVAKIFDEQLVVTWEDSEGAGTIKAQNLLLGDTTTVGIAQPEKQHAVMEVRGETLFFHENEQISQLRIFSPSGKLVFVTNTISAPVDMSAFKPAMYIAVAYDEKGLPRQQEKVVVY